MNLAYYTCFYGDENNIAFNIPDTPSLKYKCYYFTNNQTILGYLENTNWVGIYDNKPVSSDLIVSAMASKHIKAMPEGYLVLKEYDYLCYLDSKLPKVNERFVEKQIKDYFIQENFALVLRKHWFINDNVWNEFNESMNHCRYRKEDEKYINYIVGQVRAGLSEKSDEHCMTGYLLRNMKHPKIMQINETWFNHIQDCGIECQISFFFIKQMFFEYIKSFSENPFDTIL